jgi:hypothetical protein
MSSLFPSKSLKALAKGSQGVTGPIGIGERGPIGSQGNTGITGSQGYQGHTGHTGPRGAQGFIGVGLRGPQGHTGKFNSTDDINTSGTIRGATFATNYIGATAGNIAGITFQNSQVSTNLITGSTGGSMGGVTLYHNEVSTNLFTGATSGSIGGVTLYHNEVSTNLFIGSTGGSIGGVTFYNNEVSTNLFIGATSASIGGVTLYNNEVSTNLFTGATCGSIGGVTLYNNEVSTNFITGATSGSIGGVTLYNNEVSTNLFTGATSASIGGVTLYNNEVSTNLFTGATSASIGGVTLYNNQVATNLFTGATSASIGGVTLYNNEVSTNLFIGATSASIGGVTFYNKEVATNIVTGETGGSIGGVTFYNKEVATNIITGATSGSIGGVTFYNNEVSTNIITGSTGGSIGGVTFYNGEITGNIFTGALIGTATNAINLNYYNLGAIPYQTSTGTSYLNLPQVGTNFLKSTPNGPVWTDDLVNITNNQTISGKKTFSSLPELQDTNLFSGANERSLAPRKYIDDLFASAGLTGKNLDNLAALSGNLTNVVQTNYNTTFTVDVKAPSTGITFYHTNLVTKDYIDDDIPPPIQFGTPQQTSSTITIPITPQTQVYRGGFSQAYPTILGCKFAINGQQIFDSKTFDANSKHFDSRFVYPLAPQASNTTPQIIGIKLVNSPSAGLTFTGDYIVYNTQTVSTIAGYYYNYLSNSEEKSLSISYTAGQPPSATRIQSITTTSNSITISFITPYSNTVDNGSSNLDPTVTITNYRYSYSSTAASIRIGTPPVSDPGQTNTLFGSSIYNTNTNHTLTLSSLYPDSTYTLSLYAVNSLSLPNPGQETRAVTYESSLSAASLQTSYLTQSIANNVLSQSNFSPISGNQFNNGNNIFAVPNYHNTLTSPAISTLINNNSSTSTITFNYNNSLSINYDHTSRGTNGTSNKIMMLDASFNSIYVSQNFKNFALDTSGNIVDLSNNLVLNCSNSNIEDQFSSLSVQNRGYYSKLNIFSVNIKTTAITAGTGQQALNIRQTFYNNEGTLGNRSDIYNFYYDTLSGSPTIDETTTTASINTSPSTTISGLKVFKNADQITLTVTTKVTNLFNYFYKSPLLSYAFTGVSGSGSETNLTNCSNWTRDSITNQVPQLTFTNNSVAATVSSSYQTQVTVSIQATNLNSSSTQSININAICDQSSYDLLFSAGTLKVSSLLNVNSASPVSGCRVWSGPAATFYNSGTNPTYIPVDYGYNSNANSYSTIIYKHGWNICSTSNPKGGDTSVLDTIDASQELIVANGAYRSKGLTTDTYYINYTTYKNNELIDYSVTQPLYRFATFAWKYETINTANTANINKFVFTIINFKINNSTPANPLKDTTSGHYYFNEPKRFLLHYRVEDTTSGIAISPQKGKYSTLWIDGNSTSGTSGTSGSLDPDIKAVNANTYLSYIDDNVTMPVLNFTYTIVGSNLVATLDTLQFGSMSTNKFNIYCRIGLPTSISYSFTDVKLNFTY